MGTTLRCVSGLLVSMLVVTSSGWAQGQTAVQLAPDNPSRWDAAGYTGWRSVKKADIAPEWNQWSDAGALGVSAGYYWTPHLKVELEASTTSEADVFVQTPFEGLGPLTVYRFGDYHVRTTSLAGGLVYQFGDNAWFHPFLGGGIETARERSRLELQEQACDRVPCLPVRLPTQTDVSYETRPFVTGGFKWYVTERAFIRSDIRSILSGAGAEAVLWRIGIGADF